MKAFLAICLASLVASSMAVPAPSHKEKFDALLKTCQEKVGGTEADAEQLKDHEKLPESDGAKKILVCAMKEDKLIADGKFSPEGAYAIAQKVFEGKPDMDKKLEKAKDVADKCGTEVNAKPAASDEELATSILVCLMSNSKEAGLAFHEDLV